MTKRFVDTELWQKEWFQNLGLKYKLLLKYIFENCDCAGIWNMNFSLASFSIGDKVNLDDVKYINSIKNNLKLSMIIIFLLLILYDFNMEHFQKIANLTKM